MPPRWAECTPAGDEGAGAMAAERKHTAMTGTVISQDSHNSLLGSLLSLFKGFWHGSGAGSCEKAGSVFPLGTEP